MDRYDTFWLSLAPRVKLPGGEPCFPGVPARSPQQILSRARPQQGRRDPDDHCDPADGGSASSPVAAADRR